MFNFLYFLLSLYFWPYFKHVSHIGFFNESNYLHMNLFSDVMV